MFRRLTLIVSLIIFSGLVVSAQQPWTLQQCIDQALKYNIQIKQSSLNNDLNKIRVTQNTATIFPSLMEMFHRIIIMAAILTLLQIPSLQKKRNQIIIH